MSGTRIPGDRSSPSAGFRAVRMIVGGRVQGVGFRFFAQRFAEQFGVRGFARNLAGGEVEILAVGERESVERLIGSVRRGPRLSRVDSLELEEVQAPDTFEEFEIRY